MILVDIVMHVMLQVTIATLLFWFVLAPMARKPFKEFINTVVIPRNTPNEMLQQYTSKEKILKSFALPDSFAYQKNTQLFTYTIIVLISTLVAGFLILLYFVRFMNLWPVLLEICIMYVIIICVQVWFINNVLSKYTPISKADIINYVNDSIRNNC